MAKAEPAVTKVSAASKAPPKRLKPQAVAASRLIRRARATTPAGSDSASYSLWGAIEEHHREVGAFLKYAEAAITSLRYMHYLHDREVGRALDKLGKAISDLRQVLDCRRTRSLGGRPGGVTYFGDELVELQKRVYEIETHRQLFHDDAKFQHELIRRFPSENPDLRRWEREQLRRGGKPKFRLSDYARQELQQTIGAVVNAARRQPQLFDDALHAVPLAASEPAPAALTDRHAELRAALIANPDEPQAAFVKRFRVHPITVRRCRRELEDARAIPVLPHRHGPAQTRRRGAQLAEAAD